MFTKSITIDRITEEQFQKLQDYWGSDITMKPNDQFGVVVTPVQTSSVEEMLYLVIEHPLCDEICARGDSNKWIKRYRRTINDSNRDKITQHMAELLTSAPEISHHFNVRLREFKYIGGHLRMERQNVNIYFRGYKGMVVGVDYIIPPKYHSIFDLGPSFTNAYIKALWDPKGILTDTH